MTKTINNWKPVIKSFLNFALAQGLTLDSVDNGDGRVKTPTLKEALDEASATDESHVFFLTPEGKRIWAFLVLGNSPEETVCDNIVNPLLDKACEEFSAKWEGVNVPRKEIKV